MGDKVDFSECPFIENEMQYYTYTDFCKYRLVIKRLYKSLSENGQTFYKWYVYANSHMKTFHKNAIWDYLNDDDPNGFELLRLARFYKPM